jgi:ankyrin repeat protein
MTQSPLTPEQQARVVAIAMDLAREGRTAELLEFLDHGLPVDVADRDGNTLLMLAAYHGHADTVEALVGRGADVDRRNGRDQSPVAGALFKGEDSVVRILVGAGADLDAGTPTARAAATMFGREDLLPDGQG